MKCSSYGIAVMVDVGAFGGELRTTDISLRTRAEAEAYAETLRGAEIFEQYCFLPTHAYCKEQGLITTPT